MVDDDKDGNRSSGLVVVGASAGGVGALTTLVSTVHKNFPAPIVLAQHLDPQRPSHPGSILERRSKLPVVIVGDFNMSDATQEYQLFTAQLTDVFRHTRRGFGSTFPNWRFDTPSLGFLPPVIRLDYAFVNRNIEPGGARVIQQGNSDHYPLLVEIRVQ